MFFRFIWTHSCGACPTSSPCFAKSACSIVFPQNLPGFDCGGSAEDPDGKTGSCLGDDGGDGDGGGVLFGGGPGGSFGGGSVGRGGGGPVGSGGWNGTSGTVGSFGNVCHCGFFECGETLCDVGMIGRGS